MPTLLVDERGVGCDEGAESVDEVRELHLAARVQKSLRPFTLQQREQCIATDLCSAVRADSNTMSVTETKVNGLPAVVLKHPSGAEALVYVYAAHLASWKTADGSEQLYMSSKTEYGAGKAMRGGVPVCWPQFATRGPYGRHGFCRNSDKWTVIRTASEPYPCVVLGL